MIIWYFSDCAQNEFSRRGCSELYRRLLLLEVGERLIRFLSWFGLTDVCFYGLESLSVAFLSSWNFAFLFYLNRQTIRILSRVRVTKSTFRVVHLVVESTTIVLHL